MKVIDLLNRIANGEEVPKKIRYQNYIYEYQHRRDTENSFNYMCNENGEYLSRRYFIDNILNDEVEIIEEDKKIEKIIPTSLIGIDNLDEKIEVVHIDTINAIDKINKIIKVINEMREDK